MYTQLVKILAVFTHGCVRVLGYVFPPIPSSLPSLAPFRLKSDPRSDAPPSRVSIHGPFQLVFRITRSYKDSVCFAVLFQEKRAARANPRWDISRRKSASRNTLRRVAHMSSVSSGSK